MKFLQSLLLVVICTTSGFGAVFTVTATGSCPADLIAVQAALDGASPGDTISLTAGNFNFACDTGGVYVGTPDLAISGVPGQTILQGSGMTDPNESPGILINTGGVKVSGITMTAFFQAIFVRGGATGVGISNCSFNGNTNGIFLGRSGTAAQIIHNSFTLPVPPSSDPSSDFGQVTAMHITARNSYLLVAGNTITGPGVVLQLQSIGQLSIGNSLGALGGRTFGIIQIDRVPPAATFGRISNNTVSQVDLGIQSSSNFGVVSNNTVTNSGLGIVVSNDTDDGQTTVTDNVVTQNVSTGNQMGIIMASATRNVLSLNDLRNNTLAGLAFISNFNGAPSINNVFVLNLGSKYGIAGNQGAFFRRGTD